MTVHVFTSARLENRAVFLSAGAPENATADEKRAFEEAVISCTRAVLSERGRLVFGGHPAVSPLVALVAGEYAPRRPGDQPLIDIYQAEPFRGHLPDETLRLFRLGHARIHWTEARDPQWKPGAPLPEDSLAVMRAQMIGETTPVAMIAIGGKKGISLEYEMFKPTQKPVYLLPMTGGETRRLADAQKGIAADVQVMKQLQERGITPKEPGELYPLVLQWIVTRIAESA